MPTEQRGFQDAWHGYHRLPQTWDVVRKQVECFTRDTRLGTVQQRHRTVGGSWAARLRPFRCSGPPTFFWQGGLYHDENWNPRSIPGSHRAMEYYGKAPRTKRGPAPSIRFDEASSVSGAGPGLSSSTFNILYARFSRILNLERRGKVGITPNPVAGLNGGGAGQFPIQPEPGSRMDPS